MFQKILIASAATFLAASAATAGASPAAPQKQAKKPAAEQKYCLQYEAIVGSRLSRTECRTKSEWAREGVNVERLLRG